MELELSKLAILLALQAPFLVWLSFRAREAGFFTLFAFAIGLFLYSGLATSAAIVPLSLLGAYVIFGIAFATSFAVAHRIATPISLRLKRINEPRLERFENSGLWKLVLLTYFALLLLKLTYPNFRLLELFSPPVPDIRTWFLARFEEERDGFIRGVDYGLVLLTPFFYLALYPLRRNLLAVSIVLFLPLYLDYVYELYIGRGKILLAILVLGIFVWVVRPERRRAMLLMGLLLGPWLVVAFSFYASLRLGVRGGDVTLFGALSEIFQSEFSFLIRTGLSLIQSGKTANLASYLAWVVSLPVPAFFKSGLDVALINYEISQIVLGSFVGDYGFYVALPGLLAESFYIYGGGYFWLHALMLGAFAGFLSTLLSRNPRMVGVYAYVVGIFFYTLNRGGVSSTLPLLVNGFIVFYVYLFFPILALRRRR